MHRLEGQQLHGFGDSPGAEFSRCVVSWDVARLSAQENEKRCEVTIKNSLFALGLSLLSAPAVAAVIQDEGHVEVQANVLARYKFEAVHLEDDDTRVGSDLLAARLQLMGVLHDVGEATVQYEGATNSLLDAYAELRRKWPIGIRVGRFRTPVGAEWQMSLKSLPTPTRTLIAERVVGRATGFDVFADFDLGGVDVRAEAGLFNPSRTSRVEPGQLLIERVRLSYEGAYLHVGYASHVMDDNASPSGGRVLPFDDQLDVAAGYDDGKTRIHAEYFRSFDDPTEEDSSNVYAFVAHIFGDPGHEVGFEPVVAVDVVKGVQEKERGQVLVNILWSERDLVTSVGVSKSFEDSGDVTEGYVFIQGAF